MIKIEIMKEDTQAQTRTIPKKGDREAFDVQFQPAYAHFDNERFPVHMEIGLQPNNGQPYPAGVYTLADSSFKINAFKSVELDRYAIKLEKAS